MHTVDGFKRRERENERHSLSVREDGDAGGAGAQRHVDDEAPTQRRDEVIDEKTFAPDHNFGGVEPGLFKTPGLSHEPAFVVATEAIEFVHRCSRHGPTDLNPRVLLKLAQCLVEPGSEDAIDATRVKAQLGQANLDFGDVVTAQMR